MSRRIYINDNNYLVIANNKDTSIDDRNSADNFYVEKNGDIFLFYRKSDNKLIENISFNDVLDKNCVVIRLDGKKNESLQIIIQDDLTDLTSFKAV